MLSEQNHQQGMETTREALTEHENEHYDIDSRYLKRKTQSVELRYCTEMISAYIHADCPI